MPILLPEDIERLIEQAVEHVLRTPHLTDFDDIETAARTYVRVLWVQNVWPGLPSEMPSAPRTEADVEALTTAGYIATMRQGIVRGLNRAPNSTPFIDFMDLSLFHLENEVVDRVLERFSHGKRWKPGDA